MGDDLDDDLADVGMLRCERCLVLLVEDRHGYLCPECGLVRI
jgi:hypothetical protein